MSQDQVFLIVALVAILVCALSINYYFHRRQVEADMRRIKAKKIKGEIQQVLDVLTVLKQTPCNPQLINLFNEHSVDLFTQLARLMPNPNLLDQVQQTQNSNSTTSLTLNSDQGIHQAQRSIHMATFVLQELKKRAKLTPLLFAEYHQELLWIHCLIETDAHMEHARVQAKANKKSAALSYCKQANIAISKTPEKDPRKDRKLSEIQSLIDEIQGKSNIQPTSASGSGADDQNTAAS